jgi:hypothetical protein
MINIEKFTDLHRFFLKISKKTMEHVGDRELDDISAGLCRPLEFVESWNKGLSSLYIIGVGVAKN